MSPLRYREVVRHVRTLEEKYTHLQILIKDALYNCEDTTLKSATRKLGDTEVVGGCRAGLTYLYIKTNGDVLMCPFIPTVVGNIGSEDIYNIWQGGDELNKIRSKDSYSVCSKCNNFSVCRGCRAEALAWTGDLMGEDPNCWQKVKDSAGDSNGAIQIIPIKCT
jgi:radical SAM protein with 4Fe4S-binding SPASM domain